MRRRTLMGCRFARRARVLRRSAGHALVLSCTARKSVVPRALSRHPRLMSSYCLCSATRSETAISTTEVPRAGTATEGATATVAEMPAATATEVTASTAMAPTPHSAASARMSACAATSASSRVPTSATSATSPYGTASTTASTTASG